MKRFLVTFLILLMGFRLEKPVSAFFQSEIEGLYNKHALIQALNNIDRLSKYQVTYQVLDKQTQSLFMSSQILVDEIQDRYDIQIQYFPVEQMAELKEDTKRSFYLHLLAFNQFQDVYLSRLSILPPLAQLDNRFEKFSVIDSEEFVPLTRVHPQKDMNGKRLSRSIKFLPNLSILTFNNQSISRRKDWLLGTASRMSLPLDIFDYKQAFSFNLKNHIDIKTIDSAGPETNLDLSLNWDWTKRPIAWTYDFSGNYKDSERPSSQLANIYQFDAGKVTKKLIHYRFMLNPKEKIYEALIEGLVEDFSLNIFDLQTAKYLTSNYQVLVRVQPYDGKLKGPEDLELISVNDLEGKLIQEIDY